VQQDCARELLPSLDENNVYILWRLFAARSSANQKVTKNFFLLFSTVHSDTFEQCQRERVRPIFSTWPRPCSLYERIAGVYILVHRLKDEVAELALDLSDQVALLMNFVFAC